MRKLLLITFTSIFLFSTQSNAQYLNGRVLNEGGSGADRVNVRFRDKANTVITNDDGSFRIQATRLPDTLIFSAPGYEEYRVIVTEKNLKDPEFEVVLLNARARHTVESTMSEVVVTSLGMKRKAKEVGYSTTKISGDELFSTGRALEGKVAGLTVTSGEPHPATVKESKFYLVDTNIVSKATAVIGTRLLTAGEINDFNKWKMWEEYGENEFKSMCRFWGMNTNKRYSVQFTDKNLNAVVNEPVYLVDKTSNDTVWKTFTDNTGKAELWANFAADKGESQYYITDASGRVKQAANEFSNGVNLVIANRPCQLSNEVDIAFVVDATGSMGDEIEFLKLEVEDVIRNSMTKFPSLNIRAGAVFYRDRGDVYVSKKAAFNDDLLKAINFIKLQGAGGGGDYPEAVDEALADAIDSLQWNKNARTRLLFLLLDAPPHNEAKDRVRDLVIKAAAKGIRIIPVACSGTDKSTEFMLRSISLATNGTYTFLTNHSGIGNSHIEPTTDKYAVELLSELLQRIIGQYLFARDCDNKTVTTTEQIHQPENILSVKIYPNPTTGKFTIETKKELKEIYVTDFTGKILLRVNAENEKGKWIIDLGGYPSATYLVRYVTKDNKWGAEKVVVIRG